MAYKVVSMLYERKVTNRLSFSLKNQYQNQSNNSGHFDELWDKGGIERGREECSSGMHGREFPILIQYLLLLESQYSFLIIRSFHFDSGIEVTLLEFGGILLRPIYTDQIRCMIGSMTLCIH
jgi:hypothetical protein